MASFLSDSWLEAMDEAASTHPHLGALAGEASLCIQQVVTDPDHGDVAYHLLVAGGRASVRAGVAPDADVTFRTDRATAAAIHRGRETAQAAFLAGRLTIEGRAVALLDHGSGLAALDDVFGSVRASTAEADA